MKPAVRSRSRVPDRPALAARLSAGLVALGVNASVAQQECLLDFLMLMSKWNGVYNLTAIRDPHAMLVMHVLDSLAIAPLIERLGVQRLLDVGSGAGLPGIPLAIVLPDLWIDSVDAVQKKIAFQTQAKAELGLVRFQAHHARIEALTLHQKPDCIVSRAFAELDVMVRLCGDQLAQAGVLLAMKGVMPEAEMASLPSGWRVREVVPLTVPDLNAARCAVLLERA